MNPEMNNKIKIPTELHGRNLLCFLYPNNYESEEEKHAIELLYKICVTNLIDPYKSNLIQDLKLTDKEKDIVLRNGWNNSENLEIKARCSDVLCQFEKNDKRQIITETSGDYLSAYKQFGKTGFIIRAVTARNIKVLNDDIFLSNIMSELKNIYANPYHLNMLVVALLKSYSIENISSIIPLIEKYRSDAVLSQDFLHERQYLDTLYTLKVFDVNEYQKEKTLSFEKEADNIVNNKQPNTVYPRIPEIYQSAYNEIFKVRNEEPVIFNRIKEKLTAENRNFAEILSQYGIKIKMPIPDNFKKHIKNQIKKIRLNYFIDVIKLFLSIPFVTKSEVEKYIEITTKGSPLPSLFGTNRLDSKGNTIGSKDPQESLRTEAHVYFRQNRLYALTSYLNLHHWAQIKTDEAELFYLLEKARPQFVDEGNIIFWVKGFCAGLNSDFITSSHILMPQLECALHNIAEIHHGNITSLEKKRQEQPTLGGILPKLKNIIEDETLFEIDTFLQSGIDVNFRNNLAHGLFTSPEIDKYGIYLLWICLTFYLDKSIINN